MDNRALKPIMPFLEHYRANARVIAKEKNNIAKEAQAKIDALKIEYIKKQIAEFNLEVQSLTKYHRNQ